MLRGMALLSLALCGALPARADPITVVPGPIEASVVSVYDGDTMIVEAYPWPGMSMRVSVRVNGIDTPEIRGNCEAEETHAVAARDFVRSLVDESKIRLTSVQNGKYAGRVVADVWVGEDNLAQLLINGGHARAYDGGAREGWCDQ